MMAETMMEWETTTGSGGEYHAGFNGITGQSVMDFIMMDVEVNPVCDLTSLNEEEIVVVPDTNIFIHSLRLIRVLLGQEPDDSFKTFPKWLILPWMVLQELDGLRKKNRAAQLAINYINELLVKKHPRLRPQRPSELAESNDEFPGSNEDDSILQCALYWCRKLPQGKVMFVTNDKNLRNKAMTTNNNNLTVCDGDSTIKEIKRMSFSFSLPEKHNHRKHDEKRSTPKFDSSLTDLHSKPKRQLIHRPLPSDYSAKKEPKDVPRKRYRSPTKPNSDSVPDISFTPIRKRTPRSLSSDLKCETFEDAIKILSDTVSYIIEFQMKEDFGDNWLQCLKISPPWTLESGLKCMLLHWIAVFSFVFGKAKKSVENLHDIVRTNNKKLNRQFSPEKEEEILELGMEMINAAEFNKSSVSKEAYFVHTKRTLLDFIRKRKDDSK